MPHLSPETQKQLVSLAKNYALKLPERVGEIKTVWEKLKEENKQEYLVELEFLLHKIQGSSGTFGFDAVSEKSKDMEVFVKEILVSNEAFQKESANKLEKYVQDLLALVENPYSTYFLEEESKEIESEKHLFIVDLRDEADELSKQITPFGFATYTFGCLDLLKEALKNNSPLGVIIDLKYLVGNEKDIAEIQEMKPSLTLIVISSRQDIEARLQAVRSGSHAYFTKPLNIRELLKKLKGSKQKRISQPYRIMIVDDDVELMQYFSLIIQQSGMLVTTVDNPLNVMEPMKNFKPDLILLDINMPGCNGLELASIFRQQEENSDIPIIFLSADSSLDNRMIANDLEADDFLTKPIEAEHLVLAIKNRVKRSRNERQLQEQLQMEHKKQDRAEERIRIAEQESKSLQQLYHSGDLQPGFVLEGSEGESYTVDNILGKGGMGVTYVATRKTDKEKVVLKTLLPKHINDTSILIRFIQEARTILNCNHPNLVKGFDIYQGKNFSYFVMEYVEGRSVEDVLKRQNWIYPDDALKIVMDIAQCLVYLERNGLVHRDIKPDNIIIDQKQVAKLVDFGIVKLTDKNYNLTTEGFMLGTPDYVSPEQIYGEQVDIRSDIYSLGVTFYRMVTGMPPFDGDSVMEILQKRLHEPPTAAYLINAVVPLAISNVIDKMIQIELDKRPQTAGALVRELENLR